LYSAVLEICAIVTQSTKRR